MITVHAPISLGELIDKITILKIKALYIEGIAKKNVLNELSALTAILDGLSIELNPLLMNQLMEINHRLWKIEDQIRVFEHMNLFEAEFIEIARFIYKLNDERAAIKKSINVSYGSAIVEEKFYVNN